MESLYVCLFSNGHIKVGRSIDPESRIASHAARVACLGIELSDHSIWECNGPAEPREADLIAKCAEHATKRNLDEWFEGLCFEDVHTWGYLAAVGDYQHQPPSRFQRLITDLKRAGMTQMQIAAVCGCTQPSISELSSGRATDPRFSIGEKLVALHAERCKAAQSSVGDVNPRGAAGVVHPANSAARN